MIRDVTRTDLGEILVLERACFSDPWTEEMFMVLLRGENKDFFALEREGKILGYLCFMSVLDQGEIMNIAVAPDFRRQGIAEALMAELRRRCRERGIVRLDLEVREGNAPAIALYKKQGFEAVGRRRGYYSRPREDAVLMTAYMQE